MQTLKSEFVAITERVRNTLTANAQNTAFAAHLGVIAFIDSAEYYHLTRWEHVIRW